MARAASAELVQLWRQRIDSHARSGLSVVGFCQAHGLQPYNFYFWRRKLAESGPRSPGVSHRRHSRGGNSSRKAVNECQLNGEEQVVVDSAGGLLPLRIVNGLSSTSVCIRFASGVTVEAPAELACRAIEQILLTEQTLRESASPRTRGAAC